MEASLVTTPCTASMAVGVFPAKPPASSINATPLVPQYAPPPRAFRCMDVAHLVVGAAKLRASCFEVRLASSKVYQGPSVWGRRWLADDSTCLAVTKFRCVWAHRRVSPWSREAVEFGGTSNARGCFERKGEK